MLKLVLMNIEFIFSAKECCCWVYALLFILYCRDWSGHKEGTHLIVSIQLSSLRLEHWRLGCSFQSQFKVSSRYSHASSEQERLELEARIGGWGTLLNCDICLSGERSSRSSISYHFFWHMSPPRRVCGEGNGTPLQYSCLENPMDGGA